MFITRKWNTDSRGNKFDESTIQAVWNKGHIIPGYDSTLVRRDVCGATIRRNEYGNTNSKSGWEIDHKRPVSKDGTSDLLNLQPLQWENNRYKGDNFPDWYCKVR